MPLKNKNKIKKSLKVNIDLILLQGSRFYSHKDSLFISITSVFVTIFNFMKGLVKVKSFQIILYIELCITAHVKNN